MKKATIFLIIIGAIILILLLWWKNGLSPVNINDKNQYLVVIAKGKGVREIANELKEKNLIKDPVVFFLLVKKLGLDAKIQAGDFRLSPSMSAAEIAENLTHGMVDIWVTIPEGKRADEIADLLSQKIPSYNETWRNTLEKNEGYLFPDTYLIPKDASIDLIISIMKNNFEKKYTTLDTTTNTHLEKNEIVILASLVEREAKFDNDRPLVASVFLNRIKIDMPLQVDATIQYALGYQKNEASWWKKSLSKTDIKFPSLYNTYLNTGLPPTPISNPGLSALNAAIHPTKTDYLYYLSDSKGHNHYAKTLEEHNANIQKYGL